MSLAINAQQAGAGAYDVDEEFSPRRSSVSIDHQVDIALSMPPVDEATLALVKPASSRHRSRQRSSSQRRRSRTCTTRRVIVGFLIFLSLFLVGTVVVLSTISFYLAIPDWAYLTEGEVPFDNRDAIVEFEKEHPGVGGAAGARSKMMAVKRQDGDEYELISVDEADVLAVEHEIMGDSTATSRYVSTVTEYDAAEHAIETGSPDTLFAGNEDEEDEEDDSSEWSPQGKGSGAYYMQANWDGKVQNMTSWERLEHVQALPGERIPRLIHQTWKSDVLPPKWRDVWRECREGMQDYEYFLWTDDLSRQFVAKYYPSFLSMYDNYRYPIQRADAIRYFILHRYGGVYMDLDIGCKRRLDPILRGDWDVVLPRTKPVGVSNDLIFSAKNHPFMSQVVHGLVAFNHQYLTNYPTVMFSTGPMFLSAQYGMYSSAHPLTQIHPRPEIRILPKSLYGKNAKIGEAPHAFFSHFYGSSWHADDAGFITFLGTWGKRLMYVALLVVIIGAVKYLFWGDGSKRGSANNGVRGSLRRGGEYQMLPFSRGREDDDEWTHEDLEGRPPTHASLSALESQAGSRSDSPVGGDSDSELTDASTSSLSANARRAAMQAMRRAGDLMLAVPAMLSPGNAPRGGRRWRGDGDSHPGLYYFLPAFIVPASSTTPSTSASEFRTRTGRGRTASTASNLPPTRIRKATAPAASRFKSGLNESTQPSRGTGDAGPSSKGSMTLSSDSLGGRQSPFFPPPPYDAAEGADGRDGGDGDGGVGASGSSSETRTHERGSSWAEWNEDRQ